MRFLLRLRWLGLGEGGLSCEPDASKIPWSAAISARSGACLGPLSGREVANDGGTATVSARGVNYNLSKQRKHSPVDALDVPPRAERFCTRAKGGGSMEPGNSAGG